MIQKFLHNTLVGNKFQSVQILFDGDQKAYLWLEVTKKKNDLSITNSFETRSIESLIEKVSKNQPLLLSFIGQGIISKKMENTSNYRSKILFNADPDDFYWYEVYQEKNVYASVARKEVIDKELALFQKAQIYVLDITIGPWIALASKPLIDTTQIATKDGGLYFDQDQLVDFQKVSNDVLQEYELGEEKISNDQIIGFSAILNHLFPNPTLVNENGFLKESKEEFIFKKAFNIAGVFVLSFFLISLLLSYLLLEHYQSENHRVQVELGQQNVAYSKLVSLEKDKENKEAILKESGLDDSNFLSFYLSEISKEIPSEINLSLVNIFPTVSKIKPEQRINFVNNSIEIEGTVSAYGPFSDWINKLKKQPWVSNLEIIDFQKESKTNSFKIKLVLKFNV